MNYGLGNVFQNAGEDFIDDFTTTVIHKELKKKFDPLKAKLQSEDESEFNEALQSALSTLQMGLAMYAVSWVTSNLLPALLKRASIAFTYIVVGKLGSKIKSLNLGGKSAGALTKAFSDLFEQRQKNVEIAMNMVNHQDTMLLKKMEISGHTKNSLDGNLMRSFDSSKSKGVDLLTHKTKTGTWQNTPDDKRLYERATGMSLPAGVPWSKLYQKLNSFQEFALNAEGAIINEAQVRFDTFVGQGMAKVR